LIVGSCLWLLIWEYMTWGLTQYFWDFSIVLIWFKSLYDGSFCSPATLKLLSDYFTSFSYTRSLKPRSEVFSLANQHALRWPILLRTSVHWRRQALCWVSMLKACEFWCSENFGYWRCLLALSLTGFCFFGIVDFPYSPFVDIYDWSYGPVDFPLHVPWLSLWLLRVSVFCGFCILLLF
jgi:hypothetical protein